MILTAEARSFLADARTATLATIDPDGRSRLVPICFVLSDYGVAPVLYSPIDEKPKSVADPRSLARVRDILARPTVAILVDRWSEDWTQLAWLRAAGRATLLDTGTEDAADPADADGNPERAAKAERAADAGRLHAIEALRAKYPQYRSHRLESRPLLRIEIDRVTTWGAV